MVTSVRTGQGLNEVRERLTVLSRDADEFLSPATPRLWIDRSFVMKGFGTVVTGTLRAGKLRVGEEVAIYPSGKTARIRSLQVHGKTVEAGSQGSEPPSI